MKGSMLSVPRALYRRDWGVVCFEYMASGSCEEGGKLKQPMTRRNVKVTSCAMCGVWAMHAMPERVCDCQPACACTHAARMVSSASTSSAAFCNCGRSHATRKYDGNASCIVYVSHACYLCCTPVLKRLADEAQIDLAPEETILQTPDRQVVWCICGGIACGVAWCVIL